ncbi:Transforming protein RhoA-like [Oopsacas minuta]|uniref:Transforming protein RhoA-like n=1 Tax=Oopsacas minuta TaxID=111878 RepID=A0AAV7JK67_9METZ|nr:Transforming protein RhoA-like [Oopsacas minuta]
MEKKFEQKLGYVPTLFENYASEIESNQGLVQVSMYDTPGDDNYSHIRPLSYPDTDILLLCFDLSSPQSYHNIFTKWLPEIHGRCKNVPLYIIGCKLDLKEHQMADQPINWRVSPPCNQEDITSLLCQTGACDYFECSAKSGTNVSEIVRHIINARMQIYKIEREKSLIHRTKESIYLQRFDITRLSVIGTKEDQRMSTIATSDGMRTDKRCQII